MLVLLIVIHKKSQKIVACVLFRTVHQSCVSGKHFRPVYSMTLTGLAWYVCQNAADIDLRGIVLCVCIHNVWMQPIVWCIMLHQLSCTYCYVCHIKSCYYISFLPAVITTKPCKYMSKIYINVPDLRDGDFILILYTVHVVNNCQNHPHHADNNYLFWSEPKY